MKLKWDTCVKVAVTAFALYLCITYWPLVGNLLSALFSAAAPLLVGCVIAYIVNILMSLYERHWFPRSTRGAVIRSRRPVCMLLAFATVVAILVLVVGLVLPQLMDCVAVIFSAVPALLDKVVDFVAGLEIVPDDIQAALEAIDWKSRISQILNALISGVGGVMDVLISTVSSVVSSVINLFMSLIFSVYLLLGKDRLRGQFDRLLNRYVKPAWCARIRYLLSVLHDSFRKYIVGQCTEAVILGVLCALGMLLLGLPYATMIGALIAVTALISVAGAYIGGVVGALMILSVSPVQAVVFVVYLVVLQQLEGNLIYPRVVGSSLGLPAIWVLAAVTVGGGILGVMGMLLSVPLAAAAYRLLRHDVEKTPSAQ